MSDRQQGAEESEPTTLRPEESFDADELGGDPTEREVEPPEHWSAVTESRPTPREDREGESLNEHLAEEVPDIEPVEQVPLAESGINALDDTTDERAAEEVADSGEEP
ncbi:hypothetical protein [Saccharopolyspora phatthalungensis]|uniref:DUF5709 domain-containing protein n=1 Tax=Saccharopolyspora phatthalungensis TaxID=664693 RepID=A0A840Q5J2_9PSEU|nr:hypothetical protein [Saccharopolyspora phatthalungensis]MBB5157772.1 hypothetical protein [Saccharopolyspora phatthalungensis]